MIVLERHRFTDMKVSWSGDDTDPMFDALVDPTMRWNGWLCPYFDRENTQRLVRYNAAIAASGGEVDTFEWRGSSLIHRYRADSIEPGEPDHEVIPPTRIGDTDYWTPGSFSWTWTEVSAGERTFTIPVAFDILATDEESAARLLVDILAHSTLADRRGRIECWWTPNHPTADNSDNDRRLMWVGKDRSFDDMLGELLEAFKRDNPDVADHSEGA